MIVSFDAYHYFGTDDLYAGYISKFLRPGGHLCVVSPGLTHELSDGPPEELAPYWDWAFCSLHSPAWWRSHWEKTGFINVDVADSLPDGWKLWADWSALCAEVGAGLGGGAVAAREAEMLRIDAGKTFGLTRITATKSGG